MTNQSLANKPDSRAVNIHQMLKKYQNRIAKALPQNMSSDRVISTVLTEIRKNPKLTECHPLSLLGAIIQASQLGLDIGPTGAHLIPFGKEVQMIPDYRGLMQLARNTGLIDVIYAQSVRQNDYFDYQYGTGKFLTFKPARNNRGDLTDFFAIAEFKNGNTQFEVLTLDDIQGIRNKSKAKSSGPWVTDYEAMAKKTVIRQLCKYLPASSELQQAVMLDEMNEREINQNNRSIIDIELTDDDVSFDSPIEMPKATEK